MQTRRRPRAGSRALLRRRRRRCRRRRRNDAKSHARMRRHVALLALDERQLAGVRVRVGRAGCAPDAARAPSHPYRRQGRSLRLCLCGRQCWSRGADQGRVRCVLLLLLLLLRERIRRRTLLLLVNRISDDLDRAQAFMPALRDVDPDGSGRRRGRHDRVCPCV